MFNRLHVSPSRIAKPAPSLLATLLCSFLLCAFLLCSFSGCSKLAQLTGEQLVEIDSKPLVIDVFTARGFLGGSDYEHYKIEDGMLWRECGNVAGSGQPKGSTAGDPNLVRLQSDLEQLTPTQLRELKLQAEQFLVSQEASKRRKLPRPGSVFSLAGPGLVEMSVAYGDRRQHAVTSVDAIAEGDTTALTAANRLFATVRGIGPVICNTRTFFGIKRAQIAER